MMLGKVTRHSISLVENVSRESFLSIRSRVFYVLFAAGDKDALFVVGESGTTYKAHGAQ